MSKPLIGTKSTKKCPECGGDTVIEPNSVNSATKLRTCTNLVEPTFQDFGNTNHLPLEACTWAEEIYANGKPVKQ